VNSELRYVVKRLVEGFDNLDTKTQEAASAMIVRATLEGLDDYGDEQAKRWAGREEREAAEETGNGVARIERAIERLCSFIEGKKAGDGMEPGPTRYPGSIP